MVAGTFLDAWGQEVGSSDGSTALLRWRGAAVTVKNTFINVIPDDADDEEVVRLQAVRRWDAKSCPNHIVYGDEELSATLLATREHCNAKLADPASARPLAPELQTFNLEERSLVHKPVSDDQKALLQRLLCNEPVSIDQMGLLRRLLCDDLSTATQQDSTGSMMRSEEYVRRAESPRTSQITGGLKAEESIVHELRDACPVSKGLLLTKIEERTCSGCLDFMHEAPTPIVRWRHGASDQGVPIRNGVLHSDVSSEFYMPVVAMGTRRMPSRQDSGSQDKNGRVVQEPNMQMHDDVVEGGASVPLDIDPKPMVAARRRRGGTRQNRLMCHVYLDPFMLTPFMEPGFDLVKKVIGRGGCNMRRIFELTQTKIRVRGKGSGHKELHNGKEASVPLMVALAADHENVDDFKTAFNMIKELLQDLSHRFDGFLRQHHVHNQALQNRQRFWVGEISAAAKACLGELTDGMLICHA